MNAIEQAVFVTEHNQKITQLYAQLQAARTDQARYQQLFDLFIKTQDERAAFEAALNARRN